MSGRVTASDRRRPIWRRVLGCLLIGASTLALTGCQQLLFRQDHRITVTTPSNFATVAQPVTVTWTTKDFTAPRDGSFAVFIDRDPMPPGETMDFFGPHDRTHNIYLLRDLTLTIDHIAPNAGANDVERNHHDLTVVLLDTTGHRVGETAGFVEFTTSE